MDILAVTIALIVGFLVGVILSKSVTSEIKDAEHRLHALYDGLLNDTQESFGVVNQDVESIVARLKAVEHNIDVKIASQIVGHQS